MYQTLCLLESEVDVTQFQLKTSQFISYWESKEPEFIGYFKDHYQDRAGKSRSKLLDTTEIDMKTLNSFLFKRK